LKIFFILCCIRSKDSDLQLFTPKQSSWAFPVIYLAADKYLNLKQGQQLPPFKENIKKSLSSYLEIIILYINFN